jgi:Ca2+-binding EF-hand superfamily protein
MRQIALVVVLMAAVATGTAGYSVAAEQMTREEVMATADKNHDGRIDLEEFNQRLTEVFFFADTDKDGKLSWEEIHAVVVDADPQRFKAADSDGDGKLALYEFLYALDVDFIKADTNHDGVLDMQEVAAMLARK